MLMRARSLIVALAVLLLLPLGAFTQAAAFDPAAFDVGLDPVADGFTEPVFATNAGDDRLFVVERAGVIRVIENGEVLSDPLLDITDRVGSDASERGLLGLAFPSDFPETGLFYVSYTDRDGNSVISRFQVPDQGAIANVESEQVILTQDQPEWNHNGGMIAFGPDNYLYIGFGDGGGQGDPDLNGQDLGTFLGKILRIEVDPNYTNGAAYVVPEDNPFVGDASALPEIWAYGLRNPWRFSFDTVTGDLWVADVGQSEQEEVNVIGATEAGVNFGWSDMEGPDCFNVANCNPDDYTLPIFTYTHSSGDGCSITGGYVSHGEEFAVIEGVYVFGDYCTGLIWGIGQDADGQWVASDPVETGLQISSFGQGADGTVYLVSYGDGTIYELVPPL